MKRTLGTGGGTLPRKVTATGTVGEKGQLFTVYERNWMCKSCDQENYPVRVRCLRCKKRKPEGLGHDYVQDPALISLKAGEVIAWHEAIDPATNQIYYYNKDTGVTQWERPVELGVAPHATGWFGRGQAGSTAAMKYTENNLKYISKPARKQKEFIDPKKYHIEGANEYNIWYDRTVGDIKDNSAQRDAAEDRCVIERDAGFTKADKDNWNRKAKRHFCLHFARGICAKAEECTYYHRIPLPADDAACEEMLDCFGRQRHATHKDDMSGVGSFMNPSRTLFVGGLTKAKYGTPKGLEDAVWKHFSEWGELENVNVIHRLSIAFPRYRLRTSAEFAREAMGSQTLDFEEILSIRWARDDPNPVAQDSVCRADRDALTAILEAKGFSTESAPFEYPDDYTVPQSKRVKMEGESSECSGFDYPDTDGQYVQYGQHGVNQFTATYGSYDPTDQILSSATAVGSGSGSSSGSGSGSSSGSGSDLNALNNEIGEKSETLQETENRNNYSNYFQSLPTLPGVQSSSTSISTSTSASGDVVGVTGVPKGEGAVGTLGRDSMSLSVEDMKQRLSSMHALLNLDDDKSEVEKEVEREAEREVNVLLCTIGTVEVESAGDEKKEEDEEKDEEDDEEENEEDGEWTTHIDPDTGATYYYNSATGESSWGEAPIS